MYLNINYDLLIRHENNAIACTHVQLCDKVDQVEETDRSILPANCRFSCSLSFDSSPLGNGRHEQFFACSRCHWTRSPGEASRGILCCLCQSLFMNLSKSSCANGALAGAHHTRSGWYLPVLCRSRPLCRNGEQLSIVKRQSPVRQAPANSEIASDRNASARQRCGSPPRRKRNMPVSYFQCSRAKGSQL